MGELCIKTTTKKLLLLSKRDLSVRRFVAVLLGGLIWLDLHNDSIYKTERQQ